MTADRAFDGLYIMCERFPEEFTDFIIKIGCVLGGFSMDKNHVMIDEYRIISNSSTGWTDNKSLTSTGQIRHPSSHFADNNYFFNVIRTIKEIANLANTSRGTVDRVINGRGKVSKEVRERILKVIEETNFKPNEIGRSLSLSNKKLTIGVVLGSENNPFFNLVADGIVNGADKYRNSGLKVIVKRADLFNKESILQALSEFDGTELDALVVSSLNDEEVVEKINSFHIPVVTVSVDTPVQKICHVGSDYLNSGRLIANFINLVRESGCNLGVVIGSKQHTAQIERIKIVDVKENFDSEEISKNVVRDMIAEHPEMDLIVFLGAGIVGGLEVLKEHKNQIRAITVDQNEAISEGLQSGLVLATITQHPYTQGIKAMEVLYDFLIRKKKVQDKKVMDNSIVLKESIIPHKFID